MEDRKKEKKKKERKRERVRQRVRGTEWALCDQKALFIFLALELLRSHIRGLSALSSSRPPRPPLPPPPAQRLALNLKKEPEKRSNYPDWCGTLFCRMPADKKTERQRAVGLDFVGAAAAVNGL